MTDDTTDERHCYQCGHSGAVFPDDPAENPWFLCERCGERLISFAELKQRADIAEERRIRESLQVEQFLKAKRVDRDR